MFNFWLNFSSDVDEYSPLYLDYVQFRQQVAVCQGELVSVEEASVGALLLLHAVGVDLIRQGAVQVVVQLLQGPGQTLL